MMRELEQRRSPFHILSLRLFTVGLLLIALLLARSVWLMYQKEQATRAGRTQAEQELADIKNREASMQTDIARLQTSEGMEAALREQFDMVKPGEGTIVLVDQNAPPAPPSFDLGSVATWKRLIPFLPWGLFGQ